VILENHLNQVSRLQKDTSRKGEAGLSKAQWNDDSHHALHVLITGETDGYYIDYADPVRQLGRILAEGYAYQGEPSVFGGNHARGEISRMMPPTAFINFLQNHDQIGNRAMGERISHLAPPQALRAGMAVLLLSPQPPLLFMGEEYAAPQPFLYFCDYEGELAAAITNGRRGEFAQFRAFADEKVRASIPDPNAEETYRRSCLHWEDRAQGEHAQWLQFTRDLLSRRREQIVPLIPLIAAGEASFEVSDRLLVVNWPLTDGRRLSMHANFSASSVPAPAMKGDLLYAAHGQASTNSVTMNPWDVQLWLHRND
jgi:malto-oligosyltrehalose trehalohydrolase